MQKIHVFISLEKPCRAFIYMHIWNAVWCNMKAHVVFLCRNFKKVFDIKIKNNLFLINSKHPGVSNCIHIYSFVTLTFVNFNILTNKFT